MYTHIYTIHSQLTPLTSVVICLTHVSPSVPFRCDISVCYKPDSSTDWRLRKSRNSAQIQPLHPTFCSLLCLPIVTFSGALPWDLWPLVWVVWKERVCALFCVLYVLWMTDTDCRGESTQDMQFFSFPPGVSKLLWSSSHDGDATVGDTGTCAEGVIRKLQTWPACVP